jgi:tRNA(adenine34) deaminase
MTFMAVKRVLCGQIASYLCLMELPGGDEYFMQKALQLADEAAAAGEVPIGAVVVHKGKIIGKGYNQTERLNDVTAHAEMLAITAAASALNSKFLEECTLYVTIEPCLMCAGAIRWARPERVVYGASEPKTGFTREISSLAGERIAVEGGICAEAAKEKMQAFFRSKR